MAKAKAETELLVAAALNKIRLTKLEPPISVRFVWYAPDRRKRDPNSLTDLGKATLDALVKKKVIEDDHSGIVYEELYGPIVVARDNPRIEVHIRRVEVGGGVQDH